MIDDASQTLCQFAKILDFTYLVCLIQKANISEMQRVQNEISLFFDNICNQDP